MVQSIFDMLSSSKLEVARRRLVTLTKWRQWAAELQDEEDNLKEHMPEHVRRILQHKRPVLLRKLAETELDCARHQTVRRPVQWVQNHWSCTRNWSFQATTEARHPYGGRADGTKQIPEACHNRQSQELER